MFEFIKSYLRSEDGAVTVDWVVLTAGMVGLCIAVLVAIETETGGLASDVAATVQDVDVTGAAASAALGTAGG